MEYQNIIDEYNKTNHYRTLLMKLPTYCCIKDFYFYMKNKNIIIETENVKDLFTNIRGWIDEVYIPHGDGDGIREVHKHDNKYSRNIACIFLFRILNNELTKEDKPYLYNITLYILTHDAVFTNRIRHHVYSVIINESFLSQKQKQRIINDMKTFGIIYPNGPSESDSDEPDEPDEPDRNIYYHSSDGEYHDYECD